MVATRIYFLLLCALTVRVYGFESQDKFFIDAIQLQSKPVIRVQLPRSTAYQQYFPNNNSVLVHPKIANSSDDTVDGYRGVFFSRSKATSTSLTPESAKAIYLTLKDKYDREQRKTLIQRLKGACGCCAKKGE